MRSIASQRGATLVELVVSIVIISISVTGVMMVISNVTRTSADPMIRVQASAIAQAYMEEILSQPISDPDGGETGGAELGETRPNFDDVADYNGLSDSSGAIDQNGNPMAGLGAYNVTVSVTDSTLGGQPAKRIAISVSFDGDVDFALALSSYRMI